MNKKKGGIMKTSIVKKIRGGVGSIVMGAHWNTQNTSKYSVCFDVFCVFQWAPITILPPLGVGGAEALNGLMKINFM